MARNKIQANQYLFTQLSEHAKQSDRTLMDLHRARWIATNEIEKKWLEELNVTKCERLSSKLKAATIQFDDNNYFAVVGAESETQTDYVLKPLEINAGIFTALVEVLEIPVRRSTSPLEIIETVLPQFQGCPDYSGHDLATIIGLFDPIEIFEIDPNSPIMPDDLMRLCCFWSVSNKERIILPFSKATFEVVDRLLANGASSLPFANLVSSLHSAHWQHAFLEAYRCIERLFAFQIFEQLHRELAVSLPLLKFAERLETVTGWRPKEEDAIKELFGFLPSTAQLLIEGVKNQVTGNSTEQTHRWIYKLRNSIVHFRAGTATVELSNEQWDEILRGTFCLIETLYHKYDSELLAA